ncbi:uncharacterized protein LOC104902355 isoform X1 [Beta vulgaris subsp. vulgaris]|uniref:uncharacterized protein LOC104902355 isoform X1 n=1 Tax=Beta vulgaris subsp. vulgaris TaxID=3555 RepID=UPI0020368C2C|nr:uncharacterized protein LOC104902355 isoform X1 [Beta vulgaris subsp. vulgaris]
MKVVGFCMVLWIVGVLLLSFNCFGGVIGVDRSTLVSGRIIVDGSKMNTRATSRNLKENRDDSNFDEGSCNGDVSLEDYRPFDPSPSSKASIRPGPIEHGTPIIPYIPNPKPAPPRPSNHDGSP